MLKHRELTERIIGAYYTVYNNLGYGFLEKVYENAMVAELEKQGLPVEQQKRIQVYYDGIIVGDYFADLVIEGKIIAELKTADMISEAHKAQLINYLRATTCEVGFVFNFGPEPEYARRYFDNGRKKHLQKKIRVSPPFPPNPRSIV